MMSTEENLVKVDNMSLMGSEQPGNKLPENATATSACFDMINKYSEFIRSSLQGPLDSQETLCRPKEHMCPDCGQFFRHLNNMKRHRRVHSGERPFHCSFSECPKKFPNPTALKKHLRTHTGEQPFVCPVIGCHRRFTINSNMKRHLKTHKNGKCYELLLHESNANLSVPGDCTGLTWSQALPNLDFCEINSSTLEPLLPKGKGHMCVDCGKTFRYLNNMKRHRRVHTGERPFPCSYPDCSKKFINTTALKRHLSTHTGEQPFVCPLPTCLKRFSLKNNLKRHIRMHKNTNIDLQNFPFGNCTILNNNCTNYTPMTCTNELNNPNRMDHKGSSL